MSGSVHVQTPCRLHFGMFSFGCADRPEFGGVGVMVEPPYLELTITAADRFFVCSDHAARIEKFVEVAATNWHLPELPNCEISAIGPADHTGLGVGTQLGLAIATGLRRFLQLPELPIESLATNIGRGKRSAIGLYGFQQGGLIVDAGKLADEDGSRLAHRAPVPSDWRFVLVRPRNTQGLAGEAEAAAFADLPPVPEAVTQQLWHITQSEILPALERSNCDWFGDAVYRYGRLAGECFAPVQGGPFASPQIEVLVEAIRHFGISGAGQSSWGPTVFAVTPNQLAAQDLAAWISTQSASDNWEVTIATPNNTGARIIAEGHLRIDPLGA